MPTATMAAIAFEKPKVMVTEPPIASQARKEMAPSAVLPTMNEVRRARDAVKRKA